MYAKIINGEISYAPDVFNTGMHLIVNFDRNIDLMKKYGYKPVVDIQPDYDPDTHCLSIGGYTENDNSIIINYKLNDKVINHSPSLEDRVADLEKIVEDQKNLIQQFTLLLECNNVKTKIIENNSELTKEESKDGDLCKKRRGKSKTSKNTSN